MKRIVLAVAALAAMAVAAPASAQVFVGADPGGVGVQIGPVGAGIGSRWMTVITIIGIGGIIMPMPTIAAWFARVRSLRTAMSFGERIASVTE